LDIVQYQALRLCTGAIRTTPTTSALQVEMEEMPLQLRRLQLLSTYWFRLKNHCETHPCQEILIPSWEKGKKKLNSFGWIADSTIIDLELSQINVSKTVLHPSMLPEIDTDLTLFYKQRGYFRFNYSSTIYRQRILWICKHFYGCFRRFT
jgi:hypothetical protein